MSLGNFFMYGGILAIIACVLSFMWDRKKLVVKYKGLLSDAISEGAKFKTGYAKLVLYTSDKIGNLENELKFFQDANFYNDFIALEAEKKVWEAEGLQAVKLCQEQSEKIAALQEELKSKELEINKLNLQLEGVKPFEKIPTKVSFGWNHGGKNVRAKVAEGSN